MVKKVGNFLEGVINSYSILFFSKNKIFSCLLIIISFFNPIAGSSGLISVVTSVSMAYMMGFNFSNTRAGLYSFNALLFGIGFGSFFENSIFFYFLLIIASLFTLVLSVSLGGVFSKYGLPILSIPFILTFWIILLASKEFANLGLSERNIYWINEMYATGGKSLLNIYTTIENFPLPQWLSMYFKALSSIFFQENIIAGFLLSIGILLHSRIAFSLSFVGFLGAYLFNEFTGANNISLSYYHLGSNYMMVAIGIGGFFAIPNVYSYLWAFFSIPITSVIVIALSKCFGVFSLPIFSLPFCIIILLFLYFLKMRESIGKLVLTPIQHYSPEINLYQYKNNNERLKDEFYFKFQLPFIGEWFVTQGYDGNITHKDDWGKALDFIILDNEMKSYNGSGNSLDLFYCFNKPILAPADGYVQEIVDYIEDNDIGDINRNQNWGNSIVLLHLTGLYSKLSHLKKNSFLVKQGEYVKKGQVIAYCGNSGRSPEPHLHFQIQGHPFIGSKTLAYPISSYFENTGKETNYKTFSVPQEGTFVSNLNMNKLLVQAFSFQPGYSLLVSDNEANETWEVYTNSLNQTYISSRENGAIAYFINNGSTFYFTNFYGTKDSLLYQFYLSAFKVVLSYMPQVTIKDIYPLSVVSKPLFKWIQDFLAPFIQIIKPIYILNYASIDDENFTSEIILETVMEMKVLEHKKTTRTSQIILKNGQLNRIIINHLGKEQIITCIN
ncbi:MAG TPA: urea transporter [Bacteroidia bacterium]|nr:urea transporter [Bacteroidia bacterium]